MLNRTQHSSTTVTRDVSRGHLARPPEGFGIVQREPVARLHFPNEHHQRRASLF